MMSETCRSDAQQLSRILTADTGAPKEKTAGETNLFLTCGCLRRICYAQDRFSVCRTITQGRSAIVRITLKNQEEMPWISTKL
jgi:hypothetical protein